MFFFLNSIFIFNYLTFINIEYIYITLQSYLSLTFSCNSYYLNWKKNSSSLLLFLCLLLPLARRVHGIPVPCSPCLVGPLFFVVASSPQLQTALRLKIFCFLLCNLWSHSLFVSTNPITPTVSFSGTYD